jgi:uncharacterized delta-60 repeat protein
MKNVILILRTFVIATFLLFAIDAKAQSAGSLDTTYVSGYGGITWTFSNAVVVTEVATQPDGKLIVIGGGGFSIEPGKGNFVARVNTNGTLDTTFNGVGYYNLNIPISILRSVALQPDGKIVVGGLGTSNNASGFGITRFNTNGTLDTTFNGTGSVLTQVGTGGIVNSVNVQADGKIVAAGWADIGSSRDFALVRYNNDGSLDSSFGSNGRVGTDINTTDVLYDVVLQTNGKIVAVGHSTDSLSNVQMPTIVRYNADGALDTTFGTGGKVVKPVAASVYATKAAIQADGKIIIAGSGFAPARYNTNGTPDVTFQASSDYTAYSIAVQADGKILITSFEINSVTYYVDRYNSDGTLDSTFGVGGRTLIGVPDSSRDSNPQVLILPDGKIMILLSKGNTIVYTRYRSGAVYRANFVDFDGDRREDFTLFRPASGTWFTSLDPATNYGAVQFGTSTDKIVPADYDGDGKTDISVYRPANGVWYLQRSSAGFIGVQFGAAEDIPAPSDFDGDGRTDLAVFRPSNGTWYMLNLRNNAFNAVQFGAPGDKPVAADYDGDGKSDYAVFRPETGVWFMLRSTLGFGSVQFGVSADKLVVGDYDGDDRADQAVYRPSNGTWYVLGSTAGFKSTQFGTAEDLPAPGDFDDDGKTDFAVYRPSNQYWYQLFSRGGYRGIRAGLNGDLPAANAYVR